MSTPTVTLTDSSIDGRFCPEENTRHLKLNDEKTSESFTRGYTLDQVYREHSADVARYVTRLAGTRLDPQDVVHDVFMVVQKRLGEFRGEAKMTTWLFRITLRVVQAHLRKSRQRSLLPLRLLEFHAPMAAEGPTPSEALEGRRDAELCYELLDKLSFNQRTALILFELDGQSGEEIAEKMGAQLETVWVWLHRGRSNFLKELKRKEARKLR